MKKIVGIVGVLCLILGFQNCSQSSLSSEPEAGASGTPSTKVGDLESVSLVELTSNEASQWILDVESGELRYTSAQGQVSARRCLSDDDKAELKALLEGASICKSEVPADAICTMQYSPGYAILVSDSAERTALGEKLDGCGRGAIEICGVKGTAFKAFLSHLSKDINSMSCD
ncbi:hypothetical protein [Bdellovibrio sp. HCB2-146]|uniref:hypothetical protein n=1 Tax=Bdellovibrio sp. HCB2-146 TaxID=3394362 RepID=UPI0039BCB374